MKKRDVKIEAEESTEPSDLTCWVRQKRMNKVHVPGAGGWVSGEKANMDDVADGISQDGHSKIPTTRASLTISC